MAGNKSYFLDDTLLQEIDGFTDRNEFAHTFDKMKKCLHLRSVSYVFISTHPSIPIEDSFISSHDLEWQELYYNKNFVRHDPAVKAAFNTITPVLWSDLKYRSAREKRIMGLFNEYEPSSAGITVPLRGLRGEFGILTATAHEDDFAGNRESYSRTLAQVGTYMHESFARLAGLRDDIPLPALSAREKQCLALYADGHMGAVVAEKLQVSEPAVRLYLTSARFKLHAQTTCGAVARAIRLGLI